MTSKTVIKTIAMCVRALHDARKSRNNHGAALHQEILDYLEKNVLPDGGGFNTGTRIDLLGCEMHLPEPRGRHQRLTFRTSYQHFTDAGAPDGWTDHTVFVYPDLASDFHLKVHGPDRDGVNAFIYDVFDTTLSSPLTDTQQKAINKIIADWREDVSKKPEAQ
jgi:hypothetical protein